MAQGPKPSGGSSWLGISQHVDRDERAAHSANPSFRGPRPQGTSQKGFLDLPFDPVAATIKPDYEWQYHCAGPHVHWEAHWVRVMGQFKPLPPLSPVNHGPCGTMREALRARLGADGAAGSFDKADA